MLWWAWVQKICALGILLKAAMTCDVFIFSSDTTFARYLDLPILRLMGKRLIFVFSGSDHRPPYMDGVAVTSLDDETVARLGTMAGQVKAKLRRIERQADVVVGHHLSAHFHERRIVPFLLLGIPFATETSDPAPNISRLHSLTTGAILRHADRVRDSARLATDTDLAEQVNRAWRFRAALADGPPPDWRHWMRDMVVAEHELHAGTAGVADSAFYADIRAYAIRHDAPAGVRHAIDFAHGIAEWDFATAARAAEALLPDAIARRTWYDVSALRTGGVLANLRLGRPADARRLMVEFGKIGANPPADLRTMLLNAYLLQAEREE